MTESAVIRCPECGAVFDPHGDSCAARFQALLALDHSRREPWGSRHGQAFAAFALQHPLAYASSIDRAWQALCRIYLAGEPAAHVFASIQRDIPNAPAPGGPRPLAPRNAPALTIADLGDFDPATYSERLDAWCRATLAMWGVGAPSATSETPR